MTTPYRPRLERTPDKARLLTALTCGRPDRVPYLDMAVSAHVVDAVLGCEIGKESSALDPADSVEFARRVGMDAIYMPYACPFGRIYQTASDGTRQYVDGSIKSKADLDAAVLPDTGAVLDRLDALCDAARGTGLGVVVGMDSPYKSTKIAVGFQDFLMKVHDDRDFLVHFRDRMTEFLGGLMREVLARPVDALMTAGDLCSGNGPMARPEFLREFWIGNMRDYLAPAREKGVPIILHMDGDFSTITDMMLETGVSAFHPFEVTGELDIYRVAEEVRGRAAVMGNIDCAGVLTRGTPHEVRADVRRHIQRLGPHGGYVCGTSHEVGADVPIENFIAMVEAVDEFGG